ncbi:hypothetical protein ACLOJK_035077 [Asimina triloba]
MPFERNARNPQKRFCSSGDDGLSKRPRGWCQSGDDSSRGEGRGTSEAAIGVEVLLRRCRGVSEAAGMTEMAALLGDQITEVGVTTMVVGMTLREGLGAVAAAAGVEALLWRHWGDGEAAGMTEITLWEERGAVAAA